MGLSGLSLAEQCGFQASFEKAQGHFKDVHFKLVADDDVEIIFFTFHPPAAVTVNPVFADVEFPSAEVDQFRNDKYFIDGSDQTRRIAAETHQVGIDGGFQEIPAIADQHQALADPWENIRRGKDQVTRNGAELLLPALRAQ